MSNNSKFQVELGGFTKDDYIQDINGIDTPFTYKSIYTEPVHKDLIQLCTELSENCNGICSPGEFVSSIIFAINTILGKKSSELELDLDKSSDEFDDEVGVDPNAYKEIFKEPDDILSFIVHRNVLDFTDSTCPFCKTENKISYKKFLDESSILIKCDSCGKTRMVNLEFIDKLNNYIPEEEYYKND